MIVMIPQYRKASVRRSMKRHLRRGTTLKTSRLDVLLWLDYLAFVHRLAVEVDRAAAADKSRTVTAAHVKQVARQVLQSCKG